MNSAAVSISLEHTYNSYSNFLSFSSQIAQTRAVCVADYKFVRWCNPTSLNMTIENYWVETNYFVRELPDRRIIFVTLCNDNGILQVALLLLLCSLCLDSECFKLMFNQLNWNSILSFQSLSRRLQLYLEKYIHFIHFRN